MNSEVLSYSASAGGTPGATTWNISRRSADFKILSASVVTVSEGDALTYRQKNISVYYNQISKLKYF
jgi:hypothetical protein